MGDLWTYIIAGIAAVAALLGVIAKSRASGKEAAKAEYNEQVADANADAAKRQTETMKDTNDAKANVDALPIGDAERELRDQWSRPGEHN